MMGMVFVELLKGIPMAYGKKKPTKKLPAKKKPKKYGY
tara:strand:+ start:814 stop:927 length:114 start_codon:yes stop_codon:yes gene_type:complete